MNGGNAYHMSYVPYVKGMSSSNSEGLLRKAAPREEHPLENALKRRREDDKEHKPFRSKWCLDSGASSHICNQFDMFTDYKKSHGVRISSGKHDVTDVTGTGTVTFVADVYGTEKIIMLYDVFYMENYSVNLMSVGKITASIDCLVQLDKNGGTITRNNKDKDIILVAEKANDGIYYVKVY